MTYLFSSNSVITNEVEIKNDTGNAISTTVFSNGVVVSTTHPFPVTLGSDTITITGNVNVSTVVQVNSSPEQPVHTHVTEIGNSGILTVPYMPISGNVVVTSIPTVNVGNFPASQNTNIHHSNSANITESIPLPVIITSVTGSEASFEFTSKNRLKVSTYQTVFFNTFQYSKETDVWDETLTNGATSTFNANNSAILLAVSSTAGSQVVRQTRNVQRYIPGRTSTLNFAVRMEMPVAGVRRRFGLFDINDGCYFEDGGSGTYYCALRSSITGSPVDTRVERANWNGDHLDGTGPSGVTADPEAIQMFGVEYEWYGAGKVRFVYNIGGKTYTIHTFYTANILHGPWSSTPFLPIRMEMTNVTGAAGTHYMWQGSNSLISEGVPEKLGSPQNIMSPIGGTTLQNRDTFYPILSIRLKTGALRGVILPTFCQVATLDNTSLYYQIIRNATLTGSNFVDMPDPNAFTQYDTSATGVSLGTGTVIDSGFIMGAGALGRITLDKDTSYQLGRGSMGTTSDTITVAVASTIANKAGLASMTWIEQR